MSSDRFVCELRPCNRHRRALIAGGVLALCAGIVLIVLMPLVPGWRGVLCILWVATSALELREHRLGTARIERICIHADGRVTGAGRDGAEQPLQVLPGSMLLDGIGWLRLRFADGRRYGEFVSRHAAGSSDWRRLQLIWRQRAALFGRSR